MIKMKRVQLLALDKIPYWLALEVEGALNDAEKNLSN